MTDRRITTPAPKAPTPKKAETEDAEAEKQPRKRKKMVRDEDSPAANKDGVALGDVSDEECNRLPGGNAPVNRIARMPASMSVENLKFTYFGKPLYALTNADFDEMIDLVPNCQEGNIATLEFALERLRVRVLEAQEVRQQSLEWIEETIAYVDALRPGPDGVKAIHTVWNEMMNRQFEMLRNDFLYLAQHLDKRRTELYQENDKALREEKKANMTQKVVPFEPMPVQPRAVDEIKEEGS